MKDKEAVFKPPLLRAPIPPERLRETVAMLEIKIRQADRNLERVLEQDSGTPEWRVVRMMWLARRRTLIEVWEFSTNTVWHIPRVEN